ncbi:prefoldin subunit 5-like [Mizuhopecten yessoensis]|uniref:Prefoldin subunit 5 n=1 Tax=Mizuhopecten yessoensis TaxID=6573 RepID=A0A210PRD7_MIZYE|nr:prefoldin subunit 5-like [Mizuhopecten yessoensis]OWF39077.1 Prefoldin subunit 5 [Mizuhopecten yessoensis]
MAGKQQQIDVSQLPAPQLNQLTQQLDQEIEFFSNSMNQLKLAQGKFVESQECLNKVSPDNLSKDILVPLTSSMYVPGQLSDVQNVLVDIGTGYYVEMEVSKGKQYFKRKVEYITKQMEKIQPVLQEKYRMKQATVEILQSKIQAMSLQQQGAAAKA